MEKYIGYVVQNNERGDDKPPFLGAIKVVSPSYLGFYRGVPSDFKDLERKEQFKYCIVSEWMLPSYSTASDFYLPELGEVVTFYKLVDGVFVWEGMLGHFDTYTNFFIKDSPEMDAININAEVVKNEYKTRILGTRAGTDIILYDHWAEEKDGSTKKGKMILRAAGAFHLQDEREGVELILDGLEDEEKISLIAQNKDGESLQSLLVDSTKDSENILLSGKDGDRFLKLDSTNGEENFTLETPEGKILLDEPNKTFTIEMGNVIVTLDNNAGTFKIETSTTTIEGTDGGDVEITGSNAVNINCVTASIKADAEVKVEAPMVNINNNLEVLQ